MMENQPTYEREEEIDLVALCFTLLRKYRQVVIAALICAVLFAGVAVAKDISWNRAVQKAAEESAPAPRTSAQQSYEDAMVEYREAQNTHDTNVQNFNQQLLDNERSQKTVQFNLDNAQEYIEKSVLNSIDPYNVYNARADMYVSTDYKILPGMDYQNPDYTSSVLSAYTSLLTNHEAINAIAAQFDMEERYMRELISVNGDSSTRFCEKLDRVADAKAVALGQSRIAVIVAFFNDRTDIRVGIIACFGVMLTGFKKQYNEISEIIKNHGDADSLLICQYIIDQQLQR